MMTIVKKSFIYICIIGLIGVATWYVFGEQNSFLTREYWGSFAWYKFDTHGYLLNLQNSLQTNFINLPELPKQPTYNVVEVITLLIAIINTLIYVINWIIYIAVIILLTPLKFISYTITVILSILGIRMDNIRTIFEAIYLFNFKYLEFI